MTRKPSLYFLAACTLSILACATATPRESAATPAPVQKPAEKPALPASYKDIQYPSFQYVAPYPPDSRVRLSDSITGYIIEDRSLPLAHMTIFFRESTVPDSIGDRAALDLLSPMFRRGGASGISAQALDDSLEFISADISGGLSSFQSRISIECLSRNLPEMLNLTKKIYLAPAFEKEPLEIQKSQFVNAYDHRYDMPASILNALVTYDNYLPNPRLWDATGQEYSKVTAKQLQKLAKGKFSPRRIVFALAGDFSRDSMIVALQKYFADWKAEEDSTAKTPPPLKFRSSPGLYLVDKDISQANISLNQPFLKRPNPDYYPAVVASFILGGGSFSSRLTEKVRSDEGLAYSVQSYVDNDYHNVGLTTIALQTKVESVARALTLIREETEKLAREGPTPEELALAKKTLIESLPSLFDTPASTAAIFAEDEMLGKTDQHFLDYVKEINAVTPQQVQAMISKYFDPAKMTVSIVGPADKLHDIGNFTQVPLDSLDFRH